MNSTHPRVGKVSLQINAWNGGFRYTIHNAVPYMPPVEGFKTRGQAKKAAELAYGRELPGYTGRPDLGCYCGKCGQ